MKHLIKTYFNLVPAVTLFVFLVGKGEEYQCRAQTLVDFDAIDASASVSGVGGNVVTDYLSNFGIQVSGAEARVYDSTTLVQNDTEYTIPTTVPNFLAAGSQASMTFTFDAPLKSLAFSRIGWRKTGTFGWSIPEWTATAYDNSGNVLDQVGEPFLFVPVDPIVPSESFQLNGARIHSVVFFSTGFNLGGWDTINVDDFLLEPFVIEIVIDIKPGSDPNSINLGSNGVIPVAILSSSDFDATTVDPETVTLAGADVAVRGKGSKLLASFEDVNTDDLLDLVLQVETENLDPGQFQDGNAVLTGETFDGQAVAGSDSISIVPE